MPGLLLFGFGLGIFWADRIHLAPSAVSTNPDPAPALITGLIAAFLAFGLAAAGVCLVLEAPASGRMKTLACGGGGGEKFVCAACFVIAFLAGAARLDNLLAAAARDAERAEVEARTSRDMYRIVDVEVGSRRPTTWGDELILVGVTAVDGRGAVPRKLLLWIGDGQYAKNGRSGESGRDGRGVGLGGTAGGPGGGIRDGTGDEATGVGRVSRAERLLWPGALARLGLRIRPIQSRRNPGTPDRERAWARQGIGARARLVDPDWVLLLEDSESGWAAARRAQIPAARAALRSRLGERFAGSGLSTGLARALALGDRTGLSGSVRAAFRELGLSHLIAVSGLHVGLVGAIAGWITARLLTFVRLPALGRVVPFGLSLAAATGTAWFYSWFTGASISSQRAALLLAIFALARAGRRSLTPGRALVWCALVLLALGPAGLFDLGAGLSFGACAALVVGGFWRGEVATAEPVADQRARKRLAQTISEAFWVSVAVSLATAPLVLASGLPVWLGAPALNLLAIPWTGLIVIPTSLAAAIGSSWLPELALRMLLVPAHLMERAVVRLAEVQPRFDPIDGLTLWGVVAIAGLGLLAIRVGLRAFAFFGWFAIALLGAAPARHGPALHAAPRVVFFDMGQGDAALVEGESATILIDTGGGRSDDTGGGTLIRALRSLGITRLDVLVVTHGDLDHRAGAAQVMERFGVQELWLPAGGQDDDRLARLATQAERRQVSVRWLAAGAPGMDRGDLEVDILWPVPRPAPRGRSRGSLVLPSRRSRNEGSLVLRVGVAGTRILFAADIGSEVETRLIESTGLLDADVLKVAHHGSRQSTTSAFLAAVSPAYAVVSAPCDPARGLPNGGTLDRLARAGSSIWWTGRDGAVSLGLSPIRAGLDFVGWGARRRCRGRASAS